MLAISKEDNMFKNMSIETFKEIANIAISNYQIILFTPPRILKNIKEIQDILKQFHIIPTGGHVGRHRLYL